MLDRRAREGWQVALHVGHALERESVQARKEEQVGVHIESSFPVRRDVRGKMDLLYQWRQPDKRDSGFPSC